MDHTKGQKAFLGRTEKVILDLDGGNRDRRRNRQMLMNVMIAIVPTIKKEEE
jgi:hypothetical protein